jgi:hypothetical protein
MIPDSFTGLDVKKMTTALSPKGEFIILLDVRNEPQITTATGPRYTPDA